MDSRYERDIYLFLSVYRFLAYGLAVILIQVVSLNAGGPSLQDYLLLSSIGVYTLFKVLGPLRWREEGLMTYVMLGGDVLVSLLALLLTGGLSSGFLLYSFIPVITAALLTRESVAIGVALAAPAALATAHTVLRIWLPAFVWIMEGNFLLWLIVYSVSALLFATAAYRTNLNIRRRIEMEGVVEERRRMRREIHDGVAQTLGYLNLKAEAVSQSVAASQVPQALAGMSEIRSAIQQTYQDIRESLDQLSADAATAPLVPTLAEYVKWFGERNGIPAHFEASAQPFTLSPGAELHLLRAIQESLTNVRKHAKATEVWVTLNVAALGVEAVIKDNGIGFQVSGGSANGGGAGTVHHGLRIIRERAESAGGMLTVTSAPGMGTEVRLRLPLKARGR